MKNILFTIVCLAFYFSAVAQTPIAMGAQSNFTYTENFNDVSNWTFNLTPANGTFTAGNGAAAWKGIDAATSTPAVPNALRVTALTNFFQALPTGAGGASSGLYRSNGAISLLSTGTTDNTSAAAIDFFIDFTGLNAGTLSFDWASINNSTGNRAGSLRVYASVDGVAYTEITSAQLLNFVNNNPTNGTINNVALPAIFNNAATARLRFYYHNGVGGTTGSRPRISIDNIKITALPTVACTSPTLQPTAFNTTSVIHNAISIAFTPPTTPSQNYLVLISTNATLTALPTNGTNYNIGDNIGDATVAALTNNNSVTITGLDLSTTYYFYIFAVNNICTGGPLYLSTNPLTGNATTTAGAAPCAAPTTQPTNLVFNNIGINSISGSFTPTPNTDEYLIIRSVSPTFTGTLNNGTTYNGGNFLGNGTVVTRTAGNTFTANNLTPSTTYYFFVFGLNNQNCTGGAAYNSTSPLTGNATTTTPPVCVVPSSSATQLILTATNNRVNGYFTPTNTADEYLIVRTNTATLSSLPINNTNYTVGNILGNGTIIQIGNATSILDINLTPATTYYYHIIAKNTNCTGGTKYNTTSILTSSITTTITPTLNWYYGNLHAHSAYSDGNVDNTALTPAQNYAYAKNSLCMDFLGISDHNHAGAGMSISNWQPGLNQAAAATTSNFLALYGMEWGVLSNGGHVLVYGTNQLLGWETNNFNTYVPRSDYVGTPQTTNSTGLFRTINNLGGNAFATFAHPSFSDFNNLSSLGVPYNATADSAVVGTALASGIAFSTNTTYNDPPSSFAYLDFYNRMLSKGYKLAPLMDHDNHYSNFGRSNNNRTVVIAPTISSSDFYGAMKGRNFYASEDCDTRLAFTINNQIMGSIITGNTPPAIAVFAEDPTNPSFTPTIKLMYGVSGSSVNPTQIATITANTFTFTDYALPDNINGYYYVDVTIAGNRTISAPIWYTKTSVVPLNKIDFTALLANNEVQLNWITHQETNMSHFEIEKSTDGVAFQQLGAVSAFNQTNNKYSFTDKQPNTINYYRLKVIDKNGSIRYTNTLFIQGKTSNSILLTPNPVINTATLQINSTKSQQANIVIINSLGQTVYNHQTYLREGIQSHAISTSHLSKGVYHVLITTQDEKSTKTFIKQ